MADQKISQLTNYTTPIGTDAFPIEDVTNVVTKKLTLNHLGAVLNLAEGQMINGKIVPSVASNNLTVALKGMDGNDPSATNPVYVRIGGVVRSITAALSVTKNSATNWCNAGSAELATKEIDYFVYIGYNATDGVVIGFSRIPFATIYSDFSVTTTNEKYAGISTITTAAAGDNYVNIGRFAATLSAGGGYTWSVPTFTASNLIQRPIYETRWLNWLPTYTGSGSMTYTAVSTLLARYKITNNQLDFQFITAGTTGGTASTTIIVSTPFSTSWTNNYSRNMGYLADTADYQYGFYYIGTSSINAFLIGGASWGLGANRVLSYGNKYQI